MLFAALSVLVQFALTAHAVRTGRGRGWLYVIVLLPGVGSAAYVLTQILPDLFGHRRGGGPGAMLRAARRRFEAGDFAGAIDTLDALISRHPGFRSADGHLLYARALTELGRHADALEEFEALVQNHPGAEPRVRYAQLLEELGRQHEARRVYREVLARARGADQAVRERDSAWIDMARRALS